MERTKEFMEDFNYKLNYLKENGYDESDGWDLELLDYNEIEDLFIAVYNKLNKEKIYVQRKKCL